MVAVSLIWNVYLSSTGRRVTLDDVRQVWVPGVFFGLNLATFFVGATHNSVANAALIGSLAPFLIVPLGARLFGELFRPPALVFALWLQTTYEVPIWVHLFTTLPLTLGGSLLLLRPLKGWLVCSQYFHKAEEGKLVRKGDI
jgi:hypothetical protein